MQEDAPNATVDEHMLEEQAKQEPLWLENIEKEQIWLNLENRCILRRQKLAMLEKECRRLGGAEMRSMGIVCRTGTDRLASLQNECKVRRKSLRRQRLRFLQAYVNQHTEN